VIRGRMNWRPLVTLGTQEEDMVSTNRGENMGPIREQSLVQCSSKTVGRSNCMLKKPIERIGTMVLSPLADCVYICNKIKLN